MKRKFWQYVHDRLEDAWHWVYYHKLLEPTERHTYLAGNDRAYSVSFLNGKGEQITAPEPPKTHNVITS